MPHTFHASIDIAVLLYLIVNSVFGKTFPVKQVLLALAAYSSVGNSDWYIFAVLGLYLIVFAAFMLATNLFPEFEHSGLLAGVFAVIGHIFPFYLKFRGGKGLAAFGGLILSFDPFIFLLLSWLT